jgi:hypothetical protein
MDIRDLVVEVRDINLQRVGQIPVHYLVGLKLAIRFNNVGTWELTLPAGEPMADALRAGGAGIIVTGDSGIIMSGFTVSAVKESTPSDTEGFWTIQGVSDDVILGERLAYPTPSSADVTAQTTETDIRSGAASTVMTGYVRANIGDLAPVSRQVANLTVAADTGLGSTVTKTARFRVLGELLSEVGSIDPIGFTIQQVGSDLEFSCYEPVDRSAYIRLDVVNDTLSKSSYGYGAPSVTRAIVGGTGTGTSRTFIEVSDTESLAAETLWGRRIESFVDQNNEADSDALTQAGREVIVAGGRTATSVSVMPSSDITMSYGRDWFLGDLVTIVVGDQEVAATVTEAAITVESDGIRIGATVGDPTGVDFDALITRRERTTQTRLNAVELKESGTGGGGGSLPTGGTDGQILAKIDATDYNTEWIDNYTSQVKHIVKNSSGSTMPKGSVVYISGANGTNILVSLSDADTEATSSKTIGLLEQSLTTGSEGFVIVEGLITGTGSAPLNTSAATAGQSVWLSSTAGGFVFGSPPAIPAHSVYLGVVTRAHAVNGEIFVSVQNGFELNELHDVSITSVAAGNIIQRNSGNTLWENKTIAAAGIAVLASPAFSGTPTAPTAATTVNNTQIATTAFVKSVIPFAMAAGSIILNGNGTRTRSGTVTWPSGRFTLAPIVTLGSGEGNLHASITSITSTGATITLTHLDNTNWNANYPVYWTAFQMTSGSAAG